MKASRFLFVVAIAIAALSGCRKHDRPERQNPGGNNGEEGREPTVLNLQDMSDVWTIEYGGKETRLDGNGNQIVVEVINVDGIGANTLYLVSVINRANYSSYNGDVEAFLRNELENTSEEYTYTGSPNEILFDPFRHGTWYAFVIKIDSDRKLTGEYAYKRFEVAQEEPTAEYNKWIGSWTMNSAGFTYNLTITQEEANYIYRLYGWETGDKIVEQMDKEYLETFFDNGRMYFVSQYIQSYPAENPDTDEFFLGEIDYDDIHAEMGLYIIEDEGLDLGCATLAEDGKSATILPCEVSATIGGKEFKTQFFDMLYMYLQWENGEAYWHVYNEDVPIFPFTLEKVEAAPETASTKAPISMRGWKDDSRILRGKAYVPRDQKVAVKAVKR